MMNFIVDIMLRKKNITLNDKKASGSELIQTGDIIKCFFSDETFDKFAGLTSDGAGYSAVDDNNVGNKKRLAEKDSCLEYKKAYDEDLTKELNCEMIK